MAMVFAGKSAVVLPGNTILMVLDAISAVTVNEDHYGELGCPGDAKNLALRSRPPVFTCSFWKTATKPT